MHCTKDPRYSSPPPYERFYINIRTNESLGTQLPHKNKDFTTESMAWADMGKDLAGKEGKSSAAKSTDVAGAAGPLHETAQSATMGDNSGNKALPLAPTSVDAELFDIALRHGAKERDDVVEKSQSPVASVSKPALGDTQSIHPSTTVSAREAREAHGVLGTPTPDSDKTANIAESICEDLATERSRYAAAEIVSATAGELDEKARSIMIEDIADSAGSTGVKEQGSMPASLLAGPTVVHAMQAALDIIEATLADSGRVVAAAESVGKEVLEKSYDFAASTHEHVVSAAQATHAPAPTPFHAALQEAQGPTAREIVCPDCGKVVASTEEKRPAMKGYRVGGANETNAAEDEVKGSGDEVRVSEDVFGAEVANDVPKNASSGSRHVSVDVGVQTDEAELKHSSTSEKAVQQQLESEHESDEIVDLQGLAKEGEHTDGLPTAENTEKPPMPATEEMAEIPVPASTATEKPLPNIPGPLTADDPDYQLSGSHLETPGFQNIVGGDDSASTVDTGYDHPTAPIDSTSKKRGLFNRISNKSNTSLGTKSLFNFKRTPNVSNTSLGKKSWSSTASGTKKVKLYDKVRGETKIVVGKVGRKPEKVEEGRRILRGED
ncbi:hypothetical protein HWV62_25160 [Athelia sp. TMB]|nr:hypothetical protein HWV62_25160 [Athelia sp. TMB]